MILRRPRSEQASLSWIRFFEDAANEASRDLVKTLDSTSKELEESQFASGAGYVRGLRKKAWELAMSDKSLTTMTKLPEYKYDETSRTYFPKELIRRGLCK